MNTHEKLTKARASLVLSQPFFASLALRMPLVEAPHEETMATDGASLFFNPAWVDELTLPELTGVLAHEVMHPALLHHTRRGKRDMELWNAACDYAINPLILAAGLTLPKDGLVDQRFAGMSADKIFSVLDGERPKPQEKPQGGGNGQGQGQGGQPQQASQGKPQDGQAGDSGQGKNQGTPDPGKCGAVRDAPASPGNSIPSEADLTAAEQDMKIALAQAVQAGKAQGNIPGGIDRLARGVIAPAVDWRERLRQFFQAIRPDDYRWTPPNRRYINLGLYLPSLHAESLGEIVIAIDTSGSIGSAELKRFAAEINAVAEDTKPERIHVVYCDTAVQSVAEFGPDDLPINLASKGGGGTDFRPPFKWVDDQGIDPAAMIYLTDLCSNRFPTDPGYPVLWACTTDLDNAPFGDVIHMEED